MPPKFRFLIGQLHDSQVADDLLQDTFIKAIFRRDEMKKSPVKWSILTMLLIALLTSIPVQVDVGPILNLSGARAQVEGSVIDALSTAQLEISFEDGATRQNNFQNYRLLKISQAPEIEVHFIQSDNSPTGLGEPAFPAAAPAIANAIFAATGTRIRELPFRRSGIMI